jgi:hypothetical protein
MLLLIPDLKMAAAYRSETLLCTKLHGVTSPKTAICCKHGYEPLDCVKFAAFLYQLRDGQLLKKYSTTVRDAVRVITVEPGYNDIGLYNTSYIASDILWYN